MLGEDRSNFDTKLFKLGGVIAALSGVLSPENNPKIEKKRIEIYSDDS